MLSIAISFMTKKKLILKLSSSLIGSFEAAYENSVVFHQMQQSLHLISKPVDIYFAMAQLV